jgi:predicted DCC family thiol-disulfide oxidoreductase YuxK
MSTQATTPVESSAKVREFVLFDDKCPMCTFQSRVLSRLDFGERLEMVPISDPRVSQLAPQLNRASLLEAMHVITRNGAVHRGARAIRFISGRLPLLWPLWLLLWIPGVILISEVVYSVVSRNRHLLSRMFGCKGACQILPEKPRQSSRDGQQSTKM